MNGLADVTVAPPLPNSPWVRWGHADSGVWLAIDCLDNRDQSVVKTSPVPTPCGASDAPPRTRGRPVAPGGLRRLISAAQVGSAAAAAARTLPRPLT
jgi:hypothetical protein